MCEKLLPENLKVAHYSDSQRSCLKTLVALSCQNSKFLILDDPMHDLGPTYKNELIKIILRAKQDRYMVIHSSDAELVQVLADSFIEVTESGIEPVSLEDADSFGSYRLAVQVKDGGKPSDDLIRYLGKDVDDLVLEYQTELLSYFVLPNISKALLSKKAGFMEDNRSLLSIENFEVVSVPLYEIAQS